MNRARDHRREDGAHGIGRAGLHAFELGARAGPKASGLRVVPSCSSQFFVTTRSLGDQGARIVPFVPM